MITVPALAGISQPAVPGLEFSRCTGLAAPAEVAGAAEDVLLRLDLKVPFAAILELLDASGKALEKADTEIRSHVKSDRYIIRVSTKSRTYGSYRLTASAAGN